jgi:hypothetical protein
MDKSKEKIYKKITLGTILNIILIFVNFVNTIFMDEIGVWGQTMTKGLNVLQIILIIF